MTGNLQPYPQMRDSGIKLLGKVPEHWEVRRLKDSLGVNEVVLPEDTEPDYRFHYIDIGSVGTGRLISSPRELRFEAAPSRARRVVRRGDTLVSTVRTYLKAVWHAGGDVRDLVASTGFAVLTPRPWVLPKFVSYTCRSEPFTDRVTAESVGVTYPAIAEGRLTSALRICIPPLPEQRSIARFLDDADRRIRRYIRAKERLIELLDERKRALIHEAVTGRINVRTGQPYPAYKDSGVERLGKVPEHWEVERLHRCVRVVGGMTPSMQTPSYWGGQIPWVTPKDMKRDVIGDSQVKVTRAALNSTSLRLVDSGAVLMVVRGMILAKRVPVAWTTGSVTINQDMKALSPVSHVDGEFLAHALRSGQEALIALVEVAGHGTRRLPTERWRSLRMALPPRPEQRAIVRFLDAADRRIQRQISATRRQTILLTEYRTRLIADVVTGKLDVREAAADLPETDPLAGNRDRAETIPIESNLHSTAHDMVKEAVS